MVSITENLLSDRVITESLSTPRSYFIQFLDKVVQKNVQGFLKSVAPPGLTPRITLINIFLTLTKTNTYFKLVYEQPFPY
jgi:hypothetical protein